MLSQNTEITEWKFPVRKKDFNLIVAASTLRMHFHTSKIFEINWNIKSELITAAQIKKFLIVSKDIQNSALCMTLAGLFRNTV
jgi:hypothetical protein